MTWHRCQYRAEQASVWTMPIHLALLRASILFISCMFEFSFAKDVAEKVQVKRTCRGMIRVECGKE
jgi:hypothetical protein